MRILKEMMSLFFILDKRAVRVSMMMSQLLRNSNPTGLTPAIWLLLVQMTFSGAAFRLLMLRWAIRIRCSWSALTYFPARSNRGSTTWRRLYIWVKCARLELFVLFLLLLAPYFEVVLLLLSVEPWNDILLSVLLGQRLAYGIYHWLECQMILSLLSTPCWGRRSWSLLGGRWLIVSRSMRLGRIIQSALLHDDMLLGMRDLVIEAA